MPVVRVSWFGGKNHARKSKVAAEIAKSTAGKTNTDPNYIYAIINASGDETLLSDSETPHAKASSHGGENRVVCGSRQATCLPAVSGQARDADEEPGRMAACHKSP